jgi:hypothetical protein
MHADSQSWRLKSAHLRPLFRAIADLGLEERLAEHAETRQPGAAYMGSLRAAFEFTRLVEALKERRFGDSAGMAAACPAIWPHIVRFGSEAAFKRLKTALPGPSARGKGAR